MIMIIHVKHKLHMMHVAGDYARISDHEPVKIKPYYQPSIPSVRSHMPDIHCKYS
jgi:hypothetical protein